MRWREFIAGLGAATGLLQALGKCATSDLVALFRPPPVRAALGDGPPPSSKNVPVAAERGLAKASPSPLMASRSQPIRTLGGRGTSAATAPACRDDRHLRSRRITSGRSHQDRIGRGELAVRYDRGQATIDFVDSETAAGRSRRWTIRAVPCGVRAFGPRLLPGTRHSPTVL